MLCLYIDLTPLQNQYWQLILETLKSILLIVINIGCSGYVDNNKAVIEREIRTVLEGAGANLVQSQLPERHWPLASEHHCMALNTSTRLDNGKVPWQL